MKTSICKKHGEYTENEAYVNFDPRYKDNKRLTCKKCRAEKSVTNYRKNTATHCYLHGELNETNAYVSVENEKARYRCKICCKVRRKRQYDENREQAIVDAGKWKRANRERINELARLNKLKNPEKYIKWQKDFYDRHKVNLTTKTVCKLVNLDIATYHKMLEKQQNKCAICEHEETRIWRGMPMRLCIDHCHITGKIRALLCHSCNTGLGKFNDNPDLLTKAVIYLIDHKD